MGSPEGHQLPSKTLTHVTKDQDLVDTLTKLVGLDLNSVGKPVPRPGSKKTGQAVSYWWLNANPKQWSFEQAAVGAKQTYTSHNENGNKRQKYRYCAGEVEARGILVGYGT
jgi:5-methylcytosine-specific restriction protein B